MDENLKSMGDTGKVDFKEEVNSNWANAENNANANVNENAQSDKTVEDVIKESEQHRQLSQEEAVAKAREEESIRKAEEFFGYKQEELEDAWKKVVETEQQDDNSQEIKALVEKAKQATEAAKRVTKAYEERYWVLLTENKTLKTDVLEKDIEIKALRSKIEEMSNERAHESNSLIKTNDMRLRYLANIRSRRAENPDDQSLKAKELEYLIDELSIHVPHVSPEDLRKFITKRDESIDVIPNDKSDYMAVARKVADDVTAEKKKQSIIKAISPKRINYNI